MMNKKAFTLTEMLVAMIVAAILMLTVAKMSDLALESSAKLRKEAELFSEIMYAYKNLQKHIRIMSEEIARLKVSTAMAGIRLVDVFKVIRQ